MSQAMLSSQMMSSMSLYNTLWLEQTQLIYLLDSMLSSNSKTETFCSILRNEPSFTELNNLQLIIKGIFLSQSDLLDHAMHLSLWNFLHKWPQAHSLGMHGPLLGFILTRAVCQCAHSKPVGSSSGGHSWG